MVKKGMFPSQLIGMCVSSTAIPGSAFCVFQDRGFAGISQAAGLAEFGSVPTADDRLIPFGQEG